MSETRAASAEAPPPSLPPSPPSSPPSSPLLHSAPRRRRLCSCPGDVTTDRDPRCTNLTAPGSDLCALCSVPDPPFRCACECAACGYWPSGSFRLQPSSADLRHRLPEETAARVSAPVA
eukprot:2708242-Prymnesium_polylepis.1